MEMNCREIAEAVDGRLVQSGNLDRRIGHLLIDSREVREGDFFVPLKGEKTDGHHFLDHAARNGAIGCFFQSARKPELPEGITGIAVDDPLAALQRLAKGYRARFSIPVVAVTGSTGKTTTKDMIAAALSVSLVILKTEGNLNNHIGLPLMISRLGKDHQAVVLEMGMSGAGEIELLAGLAQPTVGVITNIGESHLEMLGSREGIAAAKCELLPHLPSIGTAVINADEPLLTPYLQRLSCKIVTFGFSARSSLRCCGVETRHGKKFVRLEQDGYPPLEVVQPMPGKHTIYNLMAAVAVGRALAVTDDNIVRGLQNLQLSGMRLEVIETGRGLKIINDAYNASPSSMAAAIDVLLEQAGEAGKIAVLGDMLELGTFEKEGHLQTGRLVAEKDLDALIAVGQRAGWIARGARDAGYPSGRIYLCDTHVQAAKIVMQVGKTGDWVLLKGSRGMRMERVLDGLAGGEA
jgi:UDP-N-acetylmuramoyl-tripeptide--D-alanyl-D-alanine ligase